MNVAAGLRIERVSGERFERYIPELARLRIEVFREFPYLYDGTLDHEREYLRTYAGVPDSVIVLAIDGERVVGASTGLPMEAETDEVKRPFLERGYGPKTIFYFGESVLERAYRGQGLGVRFFEEREAHARGLARFAWTCFCAVQRPADHPRRPPDYVPLDDFWHRRGYEKHPELSTTFSWREVGEQTQSAKPMVFWLKRIER